MNCPKCNVPLLISDRQSVEIDFCPQCRGVWLERGELDKIIERSAGSFAQPPPVPAQTSGPPPIPAQRQRRHDDDYDDDDDDYRRRSGSYGQSAPVKKKKSFLSDLFDF